MRLLITVVLFCSFYVPATEACLRGTADARAIQWSTLIVEGKLISIGDSAALASPFSYRLYQFQVLQTFDGKVDGDTIPVVRFFTGGQPTGNSECGTLKPDAVGKSFVLLLRPESDVMMNAGGADPRTDELHHQHALAIVYMASADDLGPSGIDDLKTLIAQTRQAESAVTDADATLQAQTLAGAADDTEADQAAQALVQMGYKALPAIQKVYDAAEAAGKGRLKDVIAQLSLPPMAVAADESAHP